jgi:hypothetical protein
MPSYRRKAVEVDAVMEDFDAKSPTELREYLDLLDKVARIAIEGFTTVTVTVKGRPEELRDLAKELKSWQPVMGWTPDAERLFKALEGQDD